QEPCLNGGRCIGPDRCACVYGFTGRRCERDNSAVLLLVLLGVILVNSVLLNFPVKEDSSQTYSLEVAKMLMNAKLFQGYVKMANVLIQWDHFVCDCDSGYLYNEDSGACEDVNECENNADLCTHGRCVNTEGSFNCLCDFGYVPAQNQQACLDTRQENCYINLINGQCKNPLPVRLSKS
ncbi:fibrillin-1, partial [Caerostris extrusa]